jgi:hypothetical protein
MRRSVQGNSISFGTLIFFQSLHAGFTSHVNICDVLCLPALQFSPAEVLSAVSIPEYIQFIIHSLEYKTLIVEQLSEEAERAALALLQLKEKDGATVSTTPYGVLLYTCVIRDLDGVGFEHVGSKGQEIVRAVIGVASANYPGAV